MVEVVIGLDEVVPEHGLRFGGEDDPEPPSCGLLGRSRVQGHEKGRDALETVGDRSLGEVKTLASPVLE